jgi:hypothetical protein
MAVTHHTTSGTANLAAEHFARPQAAAVGAAPAGYNDAYRDIVKVGNETLGFITVPPDEHRVRVILPIESLVIDSLAPDLNHAQAYLALDKSNPDCPFQKTLELVAQLGPREKPYDTAQGVWNVTRTADEILIFGRWGEDRHKSLNALTANDINLTSWQVMRLSLRDGGFSSFSGQAYESSGKLTIVPGETPSAQEMVERLTKLRDELNL